MAKSSKQKIINTNNPVNNNDDNAVVKTKRKRKSVPRESPQQRSSVYRGVTRHRWTGRFEAHLWDKNSWNDSQNKKGKQVYLGAYDDEEAAAHAYDLAALKYWGQDTILNFPSSTYEEELKEMDSQTKEEYIGSLRRKSSGFSRGVSKFRGVARHHHNGRWEARIGRVFGNKYLYLGTYATQEEAATAYDLAAIEYRGINAVTNFDVSRYVNWIRPLQIKPNESQPSPNDSSNRQIRSLSYLNLDQDSPSPVDQTTDPLLGPTTCGTATSSALGLLLQSSKYNDMLKETRNFNSPSSSSDLDPPRSCFPDDIQTSFEFQDASSYTDGNDIIFGDCDTLISPMFQCEFDS